MNYLSDDGIFLLRTKTNAQKQRMYKNQQNPEKIHPKKTAKMQHFGGKQ